MTTTRSTHVRDVTASADQLREALSLLPTAVDDDVRDELSPYPSPDDDAGQPS